MRSGLQPSAPESEREGGREGREGGRGGREGGEGWRGEVTRDTDSVENTP